MPSRFKPLSSHYHVFSNLIPVAQSFSGTHDGLLTLFHIFTITETISIYNLTIFSKANLNNHKVLFDTLSTSLWARRTLPDMTTSTSNACRISECCNMMYAYYSTQELKL